MSMAATSARRWRLRCPAPSRAVADGTAASLRPRHSCSSWLAFPPASQLPETRCWRREPLTAMILYWRLSPSSRHALPAGLWSYRLLSCLMRWHSSHDQAGLWAQWVAHLSIVSGLNPVQVESARAGHSSVSLWWPLQSTYGAPLASLGVPMCRQVIPLDVEPAHVWRRVDWLLWSNKSFTLTSNPDPNLVSFAPGPDLRRCL